MQSAKINFTMNHYTFSLDNLRPIRLLKCPACGKKEFKLYRNNGTGEYLSDEVGKCNRIVKCNYHYTPKAYFQDNKIEFSNYKSHIQKHDESPQKVDFISYDLFEKSLNYPNHFITYLKSLFGDSVAQKYQNRFFVGSSKHWRGATIFWQIDASQNIRTGKIILFNPTTGKRIKEPFSHISWVHSVLKNQNIISDFHLKQCLFGEHQLSNEPADKMIGIVESEKTAILASILLPDFIWLATGSLTNFNENHCQVLAQRSLMVYPDLGQADRQGLTPFDKWQIQSRKLKNKLGCKILVSDLLEQNATNEEREKGLDIADYLIKTDEKYGWALTDADYPFFWDSG
jgi:hypothetical protein